MVDVRVLTAVVAVAAALGVPAGAQAPFTEEALARGLDYSTLSTDPHPYGYGAAFADLDDDGDPDLVLVGRGDGKVGVYENGGTGSFTDRSVGNGIPVVVGASGVTAADYDGDGDLDIHVSNFLGADVLLRNEGGFTFTDVTTASGVGNPGNGAGCTWGDYDGDGWLDLYVSNYTTISAAPNALYRNLGDGTFVDVLSTLGMTGGAPTYQAIFFDYDRDGDADLYISNDKCNATGYTNELWENTGGGTFVDVTSSSGTGACIDSMGIAVGDFDGNGVQDLFVCNSLFTNRLYVQDPWPCTELDTEIGLVEQEWSFGSALADIDGDGDIDILVSNSPLLGDPVAVPVRLYVNHEGQSRGWVKFRVVGRGSNRFAIGAVVEITSGGVTQMREVLTGTSYKSQSELTLHFGVDDAALIDAIEVAWPGGATTRSIQSLNVSTTWTLYPPEMLADGDLDGDTDLIDFGLFVGCMTGDVPGSLVPGCEMMDLMGDGDVDSADFVGFLARYEGPIHDCNGNGIADLEDIVDGTSDDSANGNGVPDTCETLGAPAGGVGDLTLRKVAGKPRQFLFEWSGSCMSGDGDFAIYEGSLGSFASHTAQVCSTQGSTSHVLMSEGAARYFLVVPNNGAREGSAGLGAGGSERPLGASGCLAQEIAACP